jgi:hypothetical protein
MVIKKFFSKMILVISSWLDNFHFHLDKTACSNLNLPCLVSYMSNTNSQLL